MAREYNKVIITGFLGSDPEMRFTGDGTPVASFRIAVNRMAGRADAGERREETDWFTVNAWRQLAEFCNQYLTKGQRVLVDGRLQTRSWVGQDGQKQFRTEIIANEVVFMGSRPGQGTGPGQGQGVPAGARSGGAPGGMPDDDMMNDPDDLPF
ncbi:MAG: single-stranded DNA-binding protein [Chloroflexi bacterium]|nr:single-stranded DNA-binding protein [Chloroflexota bacterium]